MKSRLYFAAMVVMTFGSGVAFGGFLAVMILRSLVPDAPPPVGILWL